MVYTGIYITVRTKKPRIDANYFKGTKLVYCFTRGSVEGGAGYAHRASISRPLRSIQLKLPEDQVRGLKPRRSVCVLQLETTKCRFMPAVGTTRKTFESSMRSEVLIR